MTTIEQIQCFVAGAVLGYMLVKLIKQYGD